MALVSSSSQFDRFSVAANELQDHIVDIYGNKENELELFRPSLADHHKVGFFTLDRCSQTDVTEVVELKDMTEVLQLLLKDVHKMKRDINLTKSVMQADYEAKVQEKATELYCRINEKVAELERIHEDRVSTVRKAFRQQLADAVARLAVLYNKNLENKMQKEKQKQAGDQYLLDEKYRELQQTIQQNQNVIQMLKLQLAQYQQSKVDLESSPSPSERPSNNTPASIQSPISQKSKSPLAPPPNLPPPPPPMETKKPKKSKPQPPPEPAREKSFPKAVTPETKIESVSMRTPSPQFNQELEDLRVEVEDLNVKVNNLQDQVDSKDDENKKLDQQIETLNQELDQEKIKSDKINKDLENTKKAAENEKASSEKLTFKDIRQFTKMDKQRAEMERMFQQKLQKAQEEAEANAQRESIAQQSAEKDKVKLLQDQKKLLEEQLAKERKKNQEKAEMDTDIDKYIKNEKRLKEEIERLKREIERVHRTWEKKFAILQQSLHALKDESYIRQTLQRQAAALHHAAVSYAVDTPMGILPTNKINSPIKKPVIPDIGRGRQQPQPQPAQGQPLNVGGVLGEKDYISYTVSAPSGRGTAMFSVDENQVMSEGEDDLPVDVQPLPDPPSRPSQEFVTDGTPSEKEKARLYHEGQKT
ncbi:inner centromere protein A-like isoform X2 [Mytilus californianus]|uniref:inner centromere protein A-like isoform X2 n=1 Tax=Mytilus californianus TaxID=6549 RepID=UPI00224681FB|nr:inner centromere protein A-like isoform X2 [Mytilus californianus]